MAKMALSREGAFSGEILGLGEVLMRSPTSYSPYKMLLSQDGSMILNGIGLQ